MAKKEKEKSSDIENKKEASPVRKMKDKAGAKAASGVQNWGLILALGAGVGLLMQYGKSQAATKGYILNGYVKDAITGTAIKGASLVAKGADGENKTATSASDGSFNMTFSQVTTGSLQVSANGYSTFNGSFSITGSTTTVAVSLSNSSGSSTPTVTPTNGLDVITTFPAQVKISSTNGANVRSAPTTASSVVGTKNYGATFMADGYTLGELYQGDNRWWTYNGTFIWVGNTAQTPGQNVTPTLTSTNPSQPISQPSGNTSTPVTPTTTQPANSNPPASQSTTPSIPTTMTFSGRIVDSRTNQGVSGAAVNASGVNTVTDSNGNFSITFNSYLSGGTATITKVGYNTTTQSFSFSSSSTINMTIPISSMSTSNPSAPALQTNTSYYTVQSGDTLSGIAVKYGTTTNYLLSLNPQITNANLINIGQTILVPTNSTTLPSTPTTITPSTSQYPRIVTVNSPIGANIRSGPGTSYGTIETYSYGSQFTAVDFTVGETVSGMSLWWKTSNGGYVWAGSTAQTP